MRRPDSPSIPAAGGRPLAVLFGLPLLAVLAGSLLAPPLFNGLTAFGRARPGWSFLRELEFESVAGRCVLVLVVLALPAAARLAGFRSLRDLGWPPASAGVRRTLAWMGWGAASLAALFALGWIGGAYAWRPEAGAYSPGRLALWTAGAGLVGVIEETLFRGLYYGAVRRFAGAWTAAVTTSLWFALVHFARPFVAEGVVHASWDDGLRLLGSCFPTGHATGHYVPYGITLFAMGLVLCRLFERDGSLHRATGLHAGWVLAMRMGQALWDRIATDGPGWFGASDLIAKSWAVLLFALAWLAAGEIRRPRPAPAR